MMLGVRGVLPTPHRGDDMDVGSVVGGYKLLELVGEGGMGTVFRGMDVMLEREVALKLLRPELTHRPDLVKRFQKEAITLARLNHPHIVTLHHMFRDGNRYFMVLEFVRGETLDHLIKRCGPIPWQTAVPLICQALRGLEHAHILKVIHRDIKPSNLILTQTGIVKLMDFGVARMLENNGLTQAGIVVGTLRYMSPEQILGHEIDFRADIYAMGVVLYEMLTGRAPFKRSTNYDLIRAMVEDAPDLPSKFVSPIPKRLEAVVLRALAKSPQDRYQSAGELRSELEDLLNGAVAEPVINERAQVVLGTGHSPEWTSRDDESVHDDEKTRLYTTRSSFRIFNNPAGAISKAATYVRSRTKGVALTAVSFFVVIFLVAFSRHEAPVSAPPVSVETAQSRPVESEHPFPQPRERPGVRVPPPVEASGQASSENAAPAVNQPNHSAASNSLSDNKTISRLERPKASKARTVKRKRGDRGRSSNKGVDGGWKIISE
ncbi:eukaryotic-like serine/threonine-protein kinase [Methylocaldum szegediense]|uniref:Eukaryotic-like serine/threonine-protein kinase n=2 Tax=Methylocaldum szegediense TaxID=73780 RepID=A0ABN8X8Q5_9GAMM|nr:eukaryotic-like serine/threonine-protein kinase [Methylocaldum szegediense]